MDENGDPIREQHPFSYRELECNAGVSHSRCSEAVGEAVEAKIIRTVQKARTQSHGIRARSASFELCWNEEKYTDDPAEFHGFYLQPTYLDRSGQTRLSRKNIPNAFFDYLIRNENRGLIRIVGALLW